MPSATLNEKLKKEIKKATAVKSTNKKLKKVVNVKSVKSITIDDILEPEEYEKFAEFSFEETAYNGKPYMQAVYGTGNFDKASFGGGNRLRMLAYMLSAPADVRAHVLSEIKVFLDKHKK